LRRLDTELAAYAAELAAELPAPYTAEEYLALLRGIYTALERHHGEETLAQMSEATVLKVIRAQVSEVIRFKRLPKLMSKTDRL